VRWTATLNNKADWQWYKSGSLAVGQTLFVPIEFSAPATTSKTMA
jgi:hypothetical protein